MRSRSMAILAALGVAVALSGCGETRKALGYDKSVPDEFKVMARAPLTLPPDFGLRPPAPGAARPQEPDPRDQAMTALFGRRSSVANASRSLEGADRTPGELALLKSTGADRNIPDIRKVVDQETSALQEEERTFTERLVFWRDTTPEGGPLVDPTKESRRLQENQALGRTVNTGDVPTIKRRRKGILEGLF